MLYKSIKYLFRVLVFCLIMPAYVLYTDNYISNSKLHLIHADYSRSTIQKNKVTRILSGNVYLKQDSTQFWCDSAVYIESEERISFYGHVRIINGEDQLEADQINYFRLKKNAIALGKVVVNRPTSQLKSSYLSYFTDTENTYARENVRIRDEENNFVAWCQELDYLPSDKITKLRNHTVVFKYDKQDTIKIYCDTLHYITPDSGKRMNSWGKVRFIQKDITANCDSASYLIDDEIINLFKKPVVYNRNNEMRGSEIHIYLKEKKPDYIHIIERSEIHSILDSTTWKEDVIKAKEIFLQFENDSLRNVRAKKNAIGRYHIEEGTDTGLNYITADSLIIFIRKNKVDSIFVAGGSEGTYYPEKLMESAP